jgi:hypothetical protein
VAGVTSHLGGPGSVTRSSCDRSGSSVLGIAGGGVGCNRGGARRPAPYFPTHPSTRCFNGFARSVVLRVLLLEDWEHMLSAGGGPERK